MNESQFAGYAVLVLLPVIASLVALIKPIISLNVSIQKLNDSIDTLSSNHKELKHQIAKHGEMLHEHESRIFLMEHREDDLK